MKELKSKININAPSSQVWDTLMDFQNYNAWNPFIKSISGDAITGNNLNVQIQPPGQNPMDFQPTVLKAEKNREFRWKGKLFMKGIFDGEHYFILESVSPTETILHHGEQFTGILSGLLLKMIGKSTLEGFVSMNLALKNKLEK